MTGAEHYAEAERLLGMVAKVVNEHVSLVAKGVRTRPNMFPEVDLLVATAHVHAVLATGYDGTVTYTTGWQQL